MDPDLPTLAYPEGCLPYDQRLCSLSHEQSYGVYNREDLWSIQRRLSGDSSPSQSLLHHYSPA